MREAASGGELRVSAPAKINLYLHVLGRRPAGYHELDSLVVFADIGDTVTARRADGLTLALEGPFAEALCGAADNLVLRAARLLADRAGVAPRAALSLRKNLPVASGIGGGSSDAAATLRALTRLGRLSLDEAELAAIAGALGADVPVCLYRRSAWLGGIGERIEAAPELPRLGIVLANPLIPLPTPDVFEARQGAYSAPARFAGAPRDGRELVALLRARRNDLTLPAIALLPEIATVLRRLEGSEGARLARMSGSGATCFALYDTTEAAARAAAAISAIEPRWWVAAGAIPSV